jgi:uncharacterized protein YnzC (UPF0291/DUF896 family)
MKEKKYINKVSCATCKFIVGHVCTKKKVGIKLSTLRRCFFYEEDSAKVNAFIENEKEKELNKPEVMTRPDWFWDRKKYLKEIKEQAKKEQAQKETPLSAYLSNNDDKHPLTGDLSRFIKSTAV